MCISLEALEVYKYIDNGADLQRRSDKYTRLLETGEFR
jgi:hypothetical protein